MRATPWRCSASRRWSVEPEALQWLGRLGLDGQLGEQSAEEAGVLHGAAGPDGQGDLWPLGDAVEEEAVVRREGVQAGAGGQLRAEEAWQALLEEGPVALLAGGVGVEGAALNRATYGIVLRGTRTESRPCCSLERMPQLQ